MSGPNMRWRDVAQGTRAAQPLRCLTPKSPQVSDWSGCAAWACAKTAHSDSPHLTLVTREYAEPQASQRSSLEGVA